MPHIEIVVCNANATPTITKTPFLMTDKTWEDMCNGSNGRDVTRAYDGTRVVVTTDPATMTVVVMRELRMCLMCEDAQAAIGDDLCGTCRERMIEGQILDGIMCASCAIGDVCVTCDNTTTCVYCREMCVLCMSATRESIGDGGDGETCMWCHENIAQSHRDDPTVHTS
jgi:hypothetical protein